MGKTKSCLIPFFKYLIFSDKNLKFCWFKVVGKTRRENDANGVWRHLEPTTRNLFSVTVRRSATSQLIIKMDEVNKYGIIVSPLTQMPLKEIKEVIKSGIAQLETKENRPRICEFDAIQNLYQLRRKSQIPVKLPSKGQPGDWMSIKAISFSDIIVETCGKNGHEEKRSFFNVSDGKKQLGDETKNADGIYEKLFSVEGLDIYYVEMLCNTTCITCK